MVSISCDAIIKNGSFNDIRGTNYMNNCSSNESKNDSLGNMLMSVAGGKYLE